MQTSTEATFPFAKLPPELRNRAYDYALVRDFVIDLRRAYLLPNRPLFDGTVPLKTFRDVLRDFQSLVRQPALTQVSRAIRVESLPIFHAQNVFVTRCYINLSALESKNGAWKLRRATRAWLFAVGLANRRMCTHVYAGSDSFGPDETIGTEDKKPVCVKWEKVDIGLADSLNVRTGTRCYKLFLRPFWSWHSKAG